MAKIGVFFGSDGGNSKEIANKLAGAFGGADVIDVAKTDVATFKSYDNLVLVTPTYGAGDVQSDWEDFLGQLCGGDFVGKTVAIVSIGDQDSYADTFADGGAHIYKLAAGNANVVGAIGTDGYEFEASAFLDADGNFCGLVLDEDNQGDLTDERIAAWAAYVAPEFK